MGIMASLSFRYIAPTTRVRPERKCAKLITLLNLHLLFWLRISAKYLLPRPDSSELHHPPPSLPNCGTAETGEIFRAVGGVLQDQVAPETR